MSQAPEAQLVVNRARPPSPSFRTDGDDDNIESLLDARGPGDSHYEWPAIAQAGIDDSQVELPAFSAGDDASSDELPAFAPEPPSEEILVGAPAQFGSGSAWARYRVTPAALIRVATLAILGIFVLHGVWNARTVGTAIMAFVAGCLGLGGLVILSKAYGAQPKRLSELTTNVRQSGPRSDLDRPIPSD